MFLPAVIIMVKAPRPGGAKTRLAPLLTPDESAALAACFFADVAAAAMRVVRDVIVAYAPADGRAPLEGALPGLDVHWLEQRGEDLGARLESVAERAAAEGFGPLIITGTDSPTLPLSFIKTARDVLAREEADVVLGPTEDGGYYLVALRQPVRGLFQRVAWSTPQAYSQTARNAARLGLRLFELPRWYDVDTPQDLLRLRDELRNDEEARRRAPSTFAWLNKRMRAAP